MKSHAMIPVLCALSLYPARPILAQDVHDHVHARGAHATERLGQVSFPNSGAPAAQAAFLRGLALLHSFEYEDAGDAFREAQRSDAAFAVAYWAEALTYAKLLWGLDDPAGARAALARLGATPADRLAKAGSERERLYGAAVEALYIDADLPTRVRGYVDGLRAVTTRFPDDLEARALLAIALQMAGGTDGLTTEQRNARQMEAISLAQSIFAVQSDHPGGAHYLIHATDHPERAHLGLAAARAYADIAPDAEHALHMPSHIFVQLGEWADVVASNERAWAASRSWVHARKVAPTELSFHALWWLQYGYLQQGRYRDARALIDTVRAVLASVDWARSDAIDARYALAQFQFMYARETGDWKEIAAEKASGITPLTNATSSRARTFGLYADYAFAFTAQIHGDGAEARRLLPRLEGAGPARALARAQVAALGAKAADDQDRYLTLLREAAGVEAEMPHFGPPSLAPAHEMLGNALLDAGRAQEAIGAFEKSLQLLPNRSAALLGLARAQAAAGQNEAASSTYKRLLANWQSADGDVRALEEARKGASSK